MTDVLKTPEKKRVRKALIEAAFAAVRKSGWEVTGEKGGVKGRVRRITKNGRSQLAAIRTSQDGWIAFPRNRKDTNWVTLSDVDVVVAATIDPAQPKVAKVHLFDAKELRERFDRAYAARQQAGHTMQIGRGIWVSLYHEESNDPVYYVGAGIGLLHKPIATVAVAEDAAAGGTQPPRIPPAATADADDDDSFEPLTIAQAKTRLARTLGVPEASVKISIEA